MIEQIDQPGLREKIVAEMSGIFTGSIIWGEDLMEVPLGQRKLGRID